MDGSARVACVAEADVKAVSGTRRLLVLTELFLPTKGGTAVWFDEVYRRLGGKDIHVMTARVPGCETHDAQHPNTVHRLNLTRHPWLRPSSLPAYTRLLLASLAIGLRYRFEAVHAGRVLPEGLVGWCVARLLRRPLVVYAHGEEITTWRRSPRRFRAMRFVYRRADRVVANSAFTRNELLGLGVRAERVAIIHPGVDLARFHPGYEIADLRASIGLGRAERLLLSVGRLSRRKGFDSVIRSLPGLVAVGIDAHLAVIGIGEDRDYLAGLARECGVADRVHLLGHVAPEDLPRWYCAADLFAMPNREIDGDTEGFGMVFVEAAACGVPALAGTAGGTGDAVQDGMTGMRVDGSNPEAVAAALRALLSDSVTRERLARHALERAHASFGWPAVAAITEREVLCRVLD